jgi:hypothetical protein
MFGPKDLPPGRAEKFPPAKGDKPPPRPWRVIVVTDGKRGQWGAFETRDAAWQVVTKLRSTGLTAMVIGPPSAPPDSLFDFDDAEREQT